METPKSGLTGFSDVSMDDSGTAAVVGYGVCAFKTHTKYVEKSAVNLRNIIYRRYSR